MSETVEIATEGGEFDAYVVGASETPRPAVIVLQEIFGVSAGIRAKADHWANAGYLASAPDLFWREGRGITLDPEVPEDFQRALGLMQATPIDGAVADIEAMIQALRARADCNGMVGIVGYCWGGLLAYLAATRTNASGCVSYYGGTIDKHLNEARAVARPLMLHIGEADAYIPANAQRAIVDALGSNPHVRVHIYPGADHAFARAGGAHRDEAAATLADARTDAFFAEHLGIAR